MGCHTWFYKKIDVSYEEAKRYVISSYEKEIELLNKWTVEHGLKYKPIYERKLQLVKSDRCKVAVCNRYEHVDGVTYYVKDKGFFVSSDELPSNLFRIGNYPEDKLFSLDETLKFIEDNKDKVYFTSTIFDKRDVDLLKQEAIIKLESFWNEYPDGMINFG